MFTGDSVCYQFCCVEILSREDSEMYKPVFTSNVTNGGRKPAKERVKRLCLKKSVCLLFIVYVERSTDAAANEKAREERETPDVP